MLKPGTILQGRIEIRSILGKGGYGAVYEAYHQLLKKTVAIKEMLHRGDPNFVNHFEREAQLLAQLDHPALPHVYDYFIQDDSFFFMMDYVPGTTLQEYVDQAPNSYLDEATTRKLVIPILDALDYLHHQNPPIIHRDLKPQNIRITPEGNVYLVDFGIAKVYDPTIRTSTSARAVTPGFSPLEQYQGGGTTAPQSDIYALGATLYYMLSGVVPPDAVQRIQHDPLEPLKHLNSEVSASIAALVHHLLAVHADQRPTHIGAVRQMLVIPLPSNKADEVPMNDLTQLAQLRAQLADELLDRQTSSNNTVLAHLTRKALEATRDRLSTIEHILQQRTYDLIFIGKVGTGKTTAICHLFNLIDEDVTTKNVGGRDKKVNVVRELLSTGSGNTTISEVVIASARTTSIKIEPYSVDEVRELIKDFCQYSWQKGHSSSTNSEGDQSAFPPEMDKAIRNVTGLKKRQVRDGDKTTTTDPAEELALKFANDEFEQFYAEVVSQAQLDKRTNTRIVYQANDAQTERQWIREVFESVNLVKLADITIPKRIYVDLSEDILNVNGFTRLGSIIDTRGLGSSLTREDLATYIREHQNALCIFTDLFPQAPTNVIDLMKLHLTPEARDLASKSLLMVLPKKGEPEKFVGEDGAVNDRNIGIDLRSSYVGRDLQDQNVNFHLENILFYDARQAYHSNGRRDNDFDNNDIEAEQTRVFEFFDTILARREELLWAEFRELESRFRDILNGQALNPQDEQLINNVHEELKGFRHAQISADEFPQSYLSFWMPSYASVLRAVNTRYGRYTLRDIDIYYSGALVAEKLMRNRTHALKENVAGYIAQISQQASPDSDLQPFINALIEQIDTYYTSFINELGEAQRLTLANDVFGPQDFSNQFWYNVQNRWGRGPGYRDDIRSMYTNELDKGDASNFLADTATKWWREKFIAPILDFFG